MIERENELLQDPAAAAKAAEAKAAEAEAGGGGPQGVDGAAVEPGTCPVW